MVQSFCSVWDPMGNAEVSQLFFSLRGETGLKNILQPFGIWSQNV